MEDFSPSLLEAHLKTTRTGWYVPFRCVARDGPLYVYDETILWELP
jgi:hypothetical protein